MSTLDKNLLLEMFRKMEEIRRMDLKIAQLVKKGKVPGMTHFSVGEEAANVGAMLALNPDDLITSNHRGHGQAIAKGIDLSGLKLSSQVVMTLRLMVRSSVAMPKPISMAVSCTTVACSLTLICQSSQMPLRFQKINLNQKV
ncbi:acetoin:2,6-dichlorophenolindophenol oxidoreductase subunit alpha [Streptococcus pneumoniae]|nr:acetoin:2,6-dichlorophenolindophenol oxidoreductase subunit alpha [Streptococcus pneumoniae]